MEKEQGRKNFSKLWTQIICTKKVYVFDAILTTVSIRRWKWWRSVRKIVWQGLCFTSEATYSF